MSTSAREIETSSRVAVRNFCQTKDEHHQIHTDVTHNKLSQVMRFIKECIIKLNDDAKFEGRVNSITPKDVYMVYLTWGVRSPTVQVLAPAELMKMLTDEETDGMLGQLDSLYTWPHYDIRYK